jgi:DNA-binding GntR family transcriptional regulator
MLATRRTDADLDDLQACIANLVRLVESQDDGPSPTAWSDATVQFHNLVLDRSGNRTLAIQAGVLREVVATHIGKLVSSTFDPPDRPAFRKNIRSYQKLVRLLEARDADGAEAHWRNHMEVARTRLLNSEFQEKTVLDLFN